MESINFNELFTGLVQMIPYGIIAFLAFLLGDVGLTMREGAGPSGSIRDGNTALGLRRLGLFVAIGIGLSGVYQNGTPNFVQDLQDSAIYALLLVVMMHIALTLNDIVTLPGVPNSQEVRNGNTAVATVEIGSLLATGFIARSAIAGEGGGVLATVVFFALGQVVLVLAVRLYELVRNRLSLVKEVEGGNVAAGLVLAAKFASYGLIISTAVGGSFVGWEAGLVSFAITAAIGLVFLLLVDWVIDIALVRSDTLGSLVTKRNVASGLVFLGGKIGMAWVISTLVL